LFEVPENGGFTARLLKVFFNDPNSIQEVFLLLFNPKFGGRGVVVRLKRYLSSKFWKVKNCEIAFENIINLQLILKVFVLPNRSICCASFTKGIQVLVASNRLKKNPKTITIPVLSFRKYCCCTKNHTALGFTRLTVSL